MADTLKGRERKIEFLKNRIWFYREQFFLLEAADPKILQPFFIKLETEATKGIRLIYIFR